MGVTNSPEILQQKTNDSFNGFWFIRAYTDNLLILTKGNWTDHVHKLKTTLNKMKEKELGYNIEKCF